MIQFTTQAPGVLVWGFPRSGQEGSTKSHETLQTKPVPVRVFSWIVLPGERPSVETGQHSPFSPILYHNESRSVLRQSRTPLITVLATVLLLFAFACSSKSIRRSGMPAPAQTVLDTAIEDIDAGRYEKLYHEAADEWRNDTTLDESKATFQKLHDKLGKVRTRDLQNVREEQTSTAPIAGHSVVALYQTSFEQGSGMETFTLVEHGGRWYLAKYYVTSNALK
ncbi:MAG TPA: DUF4019 domain-containing protein [Pyrinomonadaceae bacterium]|nr:DUF4019 domain-containing protein [Pyrinomonadaceae bacterium]